MEPPRIFDCVQDESEKVQWDQRVDDQLARLWRLRAKTQRDHRVCCAVVRSVDVSLWTSATFDDQSVLHRRNAQRNQRLPANTQLLKLQSPKVHRRRTALDTTHRAIEHSRHVTLAAAQSVHLDVSRMHLTKRHRVRRHRFHLDRFLCETFSNSVSM